MALTPSNAPRDDNQGQYAQSVDIHRIDADSKFHHKMENYSKGQEVQSISVKSSVISSKVASESIPPSTAENNDTGRAVISTSPTPIGESLKTVTKQLLQSPIATDIVITDIRTPPKIQQQIELISPGKGEAVPVLMEDVGNFVDKNNNQNNGQASTSSSGLSTWILLNGDFSSTPYSYIKKPLQQSERYSSTASSVFDTSSSKRPVNLLLDMMKITSTTEKMRQRDEQTKVKKGPRPNLGIVKPVSNPKKTLNATVKPMIQTTIAPNLLTGGELEKPLMTLQDSKFKNKTPIIVGRVPLPSKDKDKPDISAISSSMKPLVSTHPSSMDALDLVTNITRFGTPVVTFPHVPLRIKSTSTANISKEQLVTDKIQNTQSTLRPYISTMTTILFRHNASSGAIQGTTTNQPVVSTTPKPKTSSEKKKKKKKKTRRNKPSKKTSSEVESKITSVDINAASKISSGSTSRPLSTRIYNYLAREVMPNVGIGVVGLMLTAGLAGLFLYPFGGGIAARRTSYERPMVSKYGVAGPHRSHPYSHYNGLNYNHANVGLDNGQPEESVLGQVLTGMNNYPPYSRERPSSGAASSPVYDPNDNYNTPDVVGYAGETINSNSKYSTVHVASNTNNNIKYTQIDHQEKKHQTYLEDSQTESSISVVNSPSINQLSPEGKFSSMSLDGESNLDEKYEENESPVHQNKNYKSDIYDNDFEKFTEDGSNYSTDSLVNNPESANAQNVKNSMMHKPNDSYNDFISYSAGADSLYNTDIIYSEPDNKNHRSDTNFPQDYQYNLDLKKESEPALTDRKKESGNETQTIDQPSYSALEAIPNYNMETDDMYRDSSNFEMFKNNNDHGIIIEHGPRNFKIEKRSAEILDILENPKEEFNNEIDSVLPNEDKMPLQNIINSFDINHSKEKISSSEYSDSNPGSTDRESLILKNEDSKLENKKHETVKNHIVNGSEFEISSFQKPSQQSEVFSLSAMIQKITQFKIQLGIRLLQSTSQVLTKFMESFSQRMENVVRAIHDHYQVRNQVNNIPSKIPAPTIQIPQQDTKIDTFVKISGEGIKTKQINNVIESEGITTVKIESLSNNSSSISGQDLSSSNFREQKIIKVS